MASLAQEESRSIRENAKWEKSKRFAEGKFSLQYEQFPGYQKSDHGMLEIVDDEVKIIQRIYHTFLDGKTPSYIAMMLSEEGVPSPSRKPK